MSELVIRLGTRGSPLAMWQARHVASLLRAAEPGVEVELITISTRGDRDRNSPLSEITGGTGLFTKEIQRALLEGEADLAVHSLKDLPTHGPEGLAIGAIPGRELVEDVLIAPRHGTLGELPEGARVGTGSLRRQALLSSERPDLRVRPIRGNVETRLAMARTGEMDAVVLAAAGLQRLGLLEHATDWLRPPRFLPAVGQGALGVECRADNRRILGILGKLDDPPTRRAVEAERALLSELEGGCLIPLGAWGREEKGCLRLDAVVLSADGRERVEASMTGERSEPRGLGLRVAALLLAQGAERLLRPGGSRPSA